MRSASTDCPSGKEWALPNKELALNLAILLTLRHGTQMFPYKCPDCPDWHVTKTRPPRAMLDEKDWERLLGVDVPD